MKLYHCHCTECQKQSASAFGTSAIFTSEGMVPIPEELEEKLSVYSRTGEESGGRIDCYFCTKCGVRVMHRTRDTEGSERGKIVIKGGCIDGLDWKGGVHIYTRSAVVPIPEDAEQYEGAPPG